MKVPVGEHQAIVPKARGSRLHLPVAGQGSPILCTPEQVQPADPTHSALLRNMHPMEPVQNPEDSGSEILSIFIQETWKPQVSVL